MLVRLQAISDHRSTLASSVVASSDVGVVWLRLWPYAGEQRSSLTTENAGEQRDCKTTENAGEQRVCKTTENAGERRVSKTTASADE
jgi:hypothetical protein